MIFAFAVAVFVALPGQTTPSTTGPATAEYGGIYTVSDGSPMIIAPVNDTLVRYRDLDSGLIGVVARVEPDRFTSEAASFEFERTGAGEISAAAWKLAEGVGGRGRRRTVSGEPVSWRSGDANLSGILVLPDGEGPHPVMIVQPGASWTTRYSSNTLETAYTFAAYGIGALAYDRRGWGGSTGEQLVSFETSARDLAAGVEFLGSRFDVNPRHLGVWALSQGAWIAPLAGSMTERIAVYVLVGAPGTSPARQEIQRAGALLEAKGFPESEVEAIRSFQNISFNYSVTGEGWPEYARARARAEDKGWLRYVWSPKEPGSDNFLWGRLNGYYNPLPSLLELDEPVLALWGEHDVNVLPEVHRAIFEVALDAAGNRDFTLEIVPGADHVLQETTSRAPEDVEDRFASGVWQRMATWILRRSGADRDQPEGLR